MCDKINNNEIYMNVVKQIATEYRLPIEVLLVEITSDLWLVTFVQLHIVYKRPVAKNIRIEVSLSSLNFSFVSIIVFMSFSNDTLINKANT